MKNNTIKNVFKIAVGYIYFLLKKKIRYKGVMFLNYHRIGNDSDYLNMAVSKNEFCKQMEFINENFKLISFDDAIGRLKNNEVDDLYFSITFDDGFKDNSLAFDYLRTIQIKPIIFLSVDAVDRKEVFWFEKMRISSKNNIAYTEFFNKDNLDDIYCYLKTIPHDARHALIDELMEKQGIERSNTLLEEMFTWQDLEQYVSRDEIIIGSHGMSHESLKFYDKNQIRKELKLSKGKIQEKLGINVVNYAYPNGGNEDIPHGIGHIFQTLGYENAFGLGGGINKKISYQMKRVCMTTGVYKFEGSTFNKYIFSFNILKNILLGVYSK